MFRHLLPLSKEWKNIGTLLEIPSGTLDRISCDEQSTNDRLREMLKEWLKQSNPQPTFKRLIEAVKQFNSSMADEMNQHLIDIPTQ